MKTTGYCGLAKAVKSLGLHTESRIEVDFVVSSHLLNGVFWYVPKRVQASSIGSLKESFLERIYMAAQGSGSDHMGKPARQKPMAGTHQNILENLKSHFRIYFPTHETVAQSKGGTGVRFSS